MLVWMTLMIGATVLVGGTVLAVQVDRRWRRAHLQCCRCRTTWHGREKMCLRCGARGRSYDWKADGFAGFPTHDWQGYLHTGPIPRITAPIRMTAYEVAVSIPEQRSASTPVPDGAITQ